MTVRRRLWRVDSFCSVCQKRRGAYRLASDFDCHLRVTFDVLQFLKKSRQLALQASLVAAEFTAIV